MAAPTNPKTWGELQETIQEIRQAVDQLEPPPTPNDDYSQAEHGLKHNLERMENGVEAQVRVEEGEEL